MGLLTGVDLTVRADLAEGLASNGGLLPAGVYEAELVKAKRLDSDNGEGSEVVFSITKPTRFANIEVKDSLWQPKPGNQKALTRFLTNCRRLGLLKEAADGSHEPVEGINGVHDLIGRKYFVNVTTREFDGDDGGRVKVNGLGYIMIAKPDSDEVKKLGPAETTKASDKKGQGGKHDTPPAADANAGKKNEYADL